MEAVDMDECSGLRRSKAGRMDDILSKVHPDETNTFDGGVEDDEPRSHTNIGFGRGSTKQRPRDVADSPKDRTETNTRKRKHLKFEDRPVVYRPSKKEKITMGYKSSYSVVVYLMGENILDFLTVEEGAMLLDGMRIRKEALWTHLLKKLLPRHVTLPQEYPCGKKHFDRYYNEKQFIADKGWLKKHQSLRKSFFPILCNWLVELHFELFGDHSRKLMCRSPLNPIHLAMKYLFRFLSLVASISSNRLQLVGVSCYQIAVDYALGKSETAKLDLDAKRYAYYTDNAYTASEVTEMTTDIKNVLQKHQSYIPKNQLDVFTPTEALNSLMRSLLLDENILVVLFGNYLVDLSMHDTDFSEKYPSEIAASAVLLACDMAEKECTPAMREVILRSCFKSSHMELQETSRAMRRLYEGACKQETGTAIIDNAMLPKYSMVIKHYSTKFMEWIQGKLSPRHRTCLFKKELKEA